MVEAICRSQVMTNTVHCPRILIKIVCVNNVNIAHTVTHLYICCQLRFFLRRARATITKFTEYNWLSQNYIRCVMSPFDKPNSIIDAFPTATASDCTSILAVRGVRYINVFIKDGNLIGFRRCDTCEVGNVLFRIFSIPPVQIGGYVHECGHFSAVTMNLQSCAKPPTVT